MGTYRFSRAAITIIEAVLSAHGILTPLDYTGWFTVVTLPHSARFSLRKGLAAEFRTLGFEVSNTGYWFSFAIDAPQY